MLQKELSVALFALVLSRLPVPPTEAVTDSVHSDGMELCQLPAHGTELTVSPLQDLYLPNVTVHVGCLYNSSVMSGNEMVTCQSDGSWSPQFPICQGNDNKSLPEVEFSPCSLPDEPFPNGEFRLTTNGSTLVFYCNVGYKLIGADERYCLANQTWSDQTPQCISNQPQPSPAGDPTLWTRIFGGHLKWNGAYDYNGQSMNFLFLVQSVSDDQVKAVFNDHMAQFELIGSRQNSTIVFNLTRLSEQSSVFQPSTNWSVAGQLNVVDGNWMYTGTIACSLSGFSRLVMNPSPDQPSTDLLTSYDDYEDDMPSSLALTLGISIAVAAIIVAGALAAFCVRRSVTQRSQGHQSLTSFENPVYDCENVNVLK